jgi:hypothetical protein
MTPDCADTSTTRNQYAQSTVLVTGTVVRGENRTVLLATGSIPKSGYTRHHQPSVSLRVCGVSSTWQDTNTRRLGAVCSLRGCCIVTYFMQGEHIIQRTLIERR